ncbi:twin-arginine translocation pathway signal [Stenotrophomonas indicatrix]|uniref:alginate O-acetyltransferase AlgX-related protein n=1 Tax=Stenotrophomonas indicatrix TaxID=2045451 RepID=UPI00249BC6C9|nr:twin-arginine translocation pathway signal [Stenotrophomonas indicatrix]WGV55848.1 twin-arginine translocation pathway signal [Stenotrophomonas indicatrix]
MKSVFSATLRVPSARRPRLLLLAAVCALAAAGPLQAQAPAAPVAAANQDSSIVLTGKDGWLFPAWGSLTDVDSAAVARNTALIAEAQRTLAAAGVKLQVLVLPDKALFYEDKLPDGKRLGDAVRGRYALELSGLVNAHVPAVDALQAMRQVKQGGQEVFYRSDQHWTQPAADAVAAAVAAKVKEQVPTLAGQAGSGMPLGSEIKERRFGDLAELFLTDEQRRAIGRDTFTVRRQAEQQSLLDDAPAPVHVTGHSMVQPYFGFPQKLSNLIDRPVSVNWKPGNVGHWVMLLEYLESPAFKQNKPQVLVWQMFEPSYPQGPDARGQWDNASIMTPEQWKVRLHKALGQ